MGTLFMGWWVITGDWMRGSQAVKESKLCELPYTHVPVSAWGWLYQQAS